MSNPRLPPVRYIDRTRDQYQALGFPAYEWAHNEEPSKMTPLAKPLSETRLGLIATGGIYALGQTAFTHKDDTSYRSIPNDVDTADLRVSHFAYDLSDARRDINVVFPIDALRSLVSNGDVGELAPHLFTGMGGIYSQRRVNEELAPPLVRRCRDDGIDAVLLVPVWPVCHQTVGLVARQLEAAGISTVSLTSARDITLATNAPRSTFLDFPLGHTAGKVGEPELNKSIVSAALGCLESDDAGTILDLDHRWANDDMWKHDVMRVDVSPTGEATTIDERRARADTPQYQCEPDRLAAGSTQGAETDSVEPGLD